MTEFIPFPKRVLPEEQKTEKYTLAWGSAIWGAYTGSANPYLNSELNAKYLLFQKYAAGDQPEDIYKDEHALEKDNISGQRKGTNNLNYKIFAYAPRFKDTTIAMLSETTNRTNVVFLDDLSSEEKLNEKYKMQANGMLNDFVKEVDAARGMETPQDEYLPKTKKEIDIFELNGGIKLPLELALEQGIDYVMNYDVKWGTKISGDIKEDLFTIPISGVVDYLDPKTNTIKIRKINPNNTVIDGSLEYDFADAQYFGEVRSLTVLDVYKDYKATMGKELSEDEIRTIAEKGHSDVNRDNVAYDSEWVDVPKNKNIEEFMPYRVQVLDFIYLSVDIIKSPHKKVKKIEISKNKVRDAELKSGKIVKEGDKYYKSVGKQKKIEVEVWRRGKMIIDSGIVYDFGLVYDQIRDENMKPIKPFHVRRLRSKSIIDKITPNLDALQFDMLKLQELKANAAGNGLLIDMDALSNIKIGAEKFDAKKLIKLRKLTGNMLFKRSKAGNPMDKFQGAPITELKGGIGPLFNETLADINFHIGQIQMTTGLNEVAMAQDPNPEVTLGQSQIAMSGASNAIENIRDAYTNIKESVSYSVAVRLQNIAKKDKNHPVYKSVMGKSLWKALGDSKYKSIAKSEIKIIDNPNREQVANLYQQIMMALQQQTIQLQDSFYLTAMLDEGKPLKLISLILESKMERNREKAAAAANANAQQNQQAQEQMQNLKLQFEEMKVKMELMADEELQKQKYDLIQRNQKSDDLMEKEVFGEPHINNTTNR